MMDVASGFRSGVLWVQRNGSRRVADLSLGHTAVPSSIPESLRHTLCSVRNSSQRIAIPATRPWVLEVRHGHGLLDGESEPPGTRGF